MFSCRINSSRIVVEIICCTLSGVDSMLLCMSCNSQTIYIRKNTTIIINIISIAHEIHVVLVPKNILLYYKIVCPCDNTFSPNYV